MHSPSPNHLTLRSPSALLLDLDDTILDDSSLVHESWRGACAASADRLAPLEAAMLAAPQNLGMSGVWIDARGRGLPAGSAVRPDHIVRSLGELRSLIMPGV